MTISASATQVIGGPGDLFDEFSEDWVETVEKELNSYKSLIDAAVAESKVRANTPKEITVTYADREKALNDLISQVPVNTNKAGLVCPSCLGGPVAEKSFSITRVSYRALFLCHRASCGFKGSQYDTQAAGISASNPQNLAQREARPPAYFGRTINLPPEREAFIKERYHLSNYQLVRAGLRWAPDEASVSGEGRLLIPLRNRYGITWGAQLRALDKSTPKSRTYLFDATAAHKKIAWCPNYNTQQSLFIVEDMFSAIRISKEQPAVALLGTHLTNDILDDVRVSHTTNTPFDRIILALDKDATNKAVDMVIRLRSLLPLTVMYLEKDVKDMTEAEFKRFLLNALPSGSFSSPQTKDVTSEALLLEEEETAALDRAFRPQLPVTPTSGGTAASSEKYSVGEIHPYGPGWEDSWGVE